MKLNRQFLIRKTHRYLGLIIGIQFILWTVGGLYFSWTNIDKIHGDHFRVVNNDEPEIPISLLSNISDSTLSIQSFEIRLIENSPYFWINNSLLIDANTGIKKDSISRDEAISVANRHILPNYQIKKVTYLSEVSAHHEYRGRPLPVWEISYHGKHQMKAYIDVKGGGFQCVRYNSWRIFDFLWMLHVMDYDSRDNINNWILRAFSILGICSIFSGFLLYTVSSRSLKRLIKPAQKQSEK